MTLASSKYLRDEFQTSISTEMVKVEGRVLPAPRINLGPQDQPLVPRDGSWDMRNKSLHDGARIDKWALACFCERCREDQLRKFSKQMGNVSSRQGLRMSEQPVVVRNGKGKISSHLTGVSRKRNECPWKIHRKSSEGYSLLKL